MDHKEVVVSLCQEIDRFLIGKKESVKFALCALLARGHLLIEDKPGVGKTTLAKTLSHVFGLDFKRIQFTNDLLPSDIIGGNIYNTVHQKFDFIFGPIFTQFILADELNRASPKTQSATLEAMEERRVTIDGKPYHLPNPFFVVATQNPFEMAGTHSLPESQLDRFLMRIEIGNPDRETEKELLLNTKDAHDLSDIKQISTVDELLKLQEKAANVRLSEPVIDYLQDIIAACRKKSNDGLSPRGAIALAKAARAWAFIEGRDYVLPEDVQSVALPTLGHRMMSLHELTGREIVNRVLSEVIVR